MEEMVRKVASGKGFEMIGVETYVGNCVGNKEKGSQNKSSETLVFTLAPPARLELATL
jgi:hypothetical protein